MDNNNEDDQEPVYEVGYKKPPRATRFQPGKSGNPKGRPKAAKSISTVYKEEANQLVPIRIGNKTVKVTKLRAIVKRLIHKAMEGNSQAMAKIMEIACMVEPQQIQQQVEQNIDPDEQKIIQEYIERLNRKNKNAD